MEDRTTFKVYPTEPLPVLFRDLEAHVAASGQPETFPGVHPGPLAKDEPFTRLGQITLDPRKRPEGDLAPCPMCHCANKFKSGWFVYLPKLEAVAIIGNECASKDTLSSAEKHWNLRQERLREEANMERLVPLLPSWLTTFETAAPTVYAVANLLKSFRREGKAFLRALSGAAKDSGVLVVHELIKTRGGPRGIRTSGSSTDTREIPVGRIAGVKALSTRFNLQADLDALVALTRPHVQRDEHSELEYITAVGPQRRQACRDLLKVERQYPLLVKAVEDSRVFFTSANLEVIRKWGEHHLPTLRFELTEIDTPQGRRLTFRAPGELWYPTLPSALWAPLPDLPGGSATAPAA
jgi:hypothetical protein